MTNVKQPPLPEKATKISINKGENIFTWKLPTIIKPEIISGKASRGTLIILISDKA